MAEQEKLSLTRTRIFLLIFFGVAVLLCITTILGTWDEQKNGVMSPEEVKQMGGSTPGQ